jgi:hypothetical protein
VLERDESKNVEAKKVNLNKNKIRTKLDKENVM